MQARSLFGTSFAHLQVLHQQCSCHEHLHMHAQSLLQYSMSTLSHNKLGADASQQQWPQLEVQSLLSCFLHGCVRPAILLKHISAISKVFALPQCFHVYHSECDFLLARELSWWPISSIVGSIFAQAYASGRRQDKALCSRAASQQDAW